MRLYNLYAVWNGTFSFMWYYFFLFVCLFYGSVWFVSLSWNILVVIVNFFEFSEKTKNFLGKRQKLFRKRTKILVWDDGWKRPTKQMLSLTSFCYLLVFIPNIFQNTKFKLVNVKSLFTFFALIFILGCVWLDVSNHHLKLKFLSFSQKVFVFFPKSFLSFLKIQKNLLLQLKYFNSNWRTKRTLRYKSKNMILYLKHISLKYLRFY